MNMKNIIRDRQKKRKKRLSIYSNEVENYISHATKLDAQGYPIKNKGKAPNF